MFRFLRVVKRLEQAEEKLDRIESAFKKLQVEWADTYEKFRNLHFRVTKRAQQIEKSEAEQAPSQEGDTVGGEETATSGNGLSPRQIELQSKILARRMRFPRQTQ